MFECLNLDFLLPSAAGSGGAQVSTSLMVGSAKPIKRTVGFLTRSAKAKREDCVQVLIDATEPINFRTCDPLAE